ncbi:MAG TPA: prephenate dehydrogenase/arogenate dehydrogenase family protein [Candidatus Saccharimonas sp.]|nr:prephenate dehydrogenase/arogenate dehydrogenase family protein [Candidatus Saccharimonas sp.]
MKAVGIIGFGSFGKFLAEKLSSYARVKVYSQSGRTSSWMVTLEEVVDVDYLVLAVPLDAYTETLEAIKPIVKPHTVIVDVCSVKVKPVETIRSIMPDQPLVATHPMFGPESASVSFAGHTFVMCPEVSTTEPYENIKHFANSLGLGVVEMSADEHDREIAVVQGLTFFIARALNDMGIHDQKLFTPSFERLLKLADLEKHHSLELFKTIQQGNPHTRAMRDNFIRVVDDVNNDLIRK